MLISAAGKSPTRHFGLFVIFLENMRMWIITRNYTFQLVMFTPLKKLYLF